MRRNLFDFRLTVTAFFARYQQGIKVAKQHGNPSVLLHLLYARNITLTPIGSLHQGIWQAANNRISKINIYNIYKYCRIIFYVGFVPNNVLIILRNTYCCKYFCITANKAEY